MSKIRGKKLTRQQHGILNSNGIKDTENWLYVKTETTKSDGNKSPAKNDDKVTVIVFQHKGDGHTVRIEV